MKIGIDARLWNESGVGRYTRNLIKNLIKIDKKNQYVIFTLSKNKTEIEKLLTKNFKIVVVNFRWHSIEEQAYFPAVLNKKKLDLVHFPYFSVPIFYKKPYVVTIHDLIIDHFPTGKASTLNPLVYGTKRLTYKFVVSKSAKKAKKIITVSNATKQEIVDHLKINSDKVVITYEGVDKDLLKAKTVKKKSDYFLYVGNAYPHKNLENLLLAYIKFSKNNPGIKLILAGKEDFFYKKIKRRINELGLDKNVFIQFPKGDNELSTLYKNAIALILPSYMEGFGLPVLEAMSLKCLVLASNIRPIKEITKGQAFLFNPDSTTDIAEKMSYALSKSKEKEIEEIKIKAFEIAKSFSWEKMAKETLKVYEGSISI